MFLGALIKIYLIFISITVKLEGSYKIKLLFLGDYMKNKGLTLLELLVVILIIAVLTGMALPAYFRAVERSRISQAELLMGKVVAAQQRYKISRGQGYASNWKALDMAPAGVARETAIITVNTPDDTFCTMGVTNDGVCDNGFQITLIGTDSKLGTVDNKSGVVATRTGNNQYGHYQLGRYYDPRLDDYYGEVLCNAGEDNTPEAQALCIDFLINGDVYQPAVMPDGTPGEY